MSSSTHILTQIFLPISLAVIMLSMGVGLTVSDFKKVVSEPKSLFVGVGAHLVILPVLAFSLLRLWPLRPEFAVGFIIIAACPEAIVSNFITHKAKGDVALSVALSAVISLVSVISLPLIVAYAHSKFLGSEALPVSAARMTLSMMFITVIPVALGMIFRHYQPTVAARVRQPLEKIAGILFLAILGAAIASGYEILVENFIELGWVSLALNFGSMTAAYLVTRGFSLPTKQSISIVLECGLQSGSQAVFIAVTLLGNQKMMIPGAVYGIVMYAGASIVLWISRRTAAVPAAYHS